MWGRNDWRCSCVLVVAVPGKATSPATSWRWPTGSCCGRCVASPMSWSPRVRSTRPLFCKDNFLLLNSPVFRAHVVVVCLQGWRRATVCPSTCRWWWSWWSPCWRAFVSAPFTPLWWVWHVRLSTTRGHVTSGGWLCVWLNVRVSLKKDSWDWR